MILKIRNGGAWVLRDGIVRASFGLVREGRIRRQCTTGLWQIRTDLAVGHSDVHGSYSDWTPDGIYLDPNRKETLTVKPEPGIDPDGFEYPAWVNCVLANGEEVFYVVSEAYLLNDHCKTIDRIR